MKRIGKESRATVTVLSMMAATVLSKLLGMLRGVLFAAVYDTGEAANAFTVASHIPLTVFDLLLSAAILSCFIPEYALFFKEDGDREKGDEFASVFFNAILLLTSILVLVGILFARPLVSVAAPGLSPGTSALAVRLLRILFPMVIFTGAAYTLVGVMQTRGRYLLPAMISAISNGGVIVYLIFFAEKLGENSIWGLSVAYLVAWFLQFLTLAVPLRLSGFRFRMIMDLRNPSIKRAFRRLPAVIAGSWLMPVTVYSGVFFSSLLTDKVSVFDYANNIYIILCGTLTYSICNYLFPKLSILSGSGQENAFADASVKALKTVTALMLPFLAAVLVLYGEGTCALYMRGNFEAEASRQTASVVRCMAVGMPFFAVTELLSRVFYAHGKTKPPMIAAVGGIAVNVLISLILVITSSPLSAIGFSYAGGQIAAALILLVFLRKNLGKIVNSFAEEFIRLFVCFAISFAVMMTIHQLLGNDPYAGGFVRNIISCILVFLPGAAAYLVSAALLHCEFAGQLFHRRKEEHV